MKTAGQIIRDLRLNKGFPLRKVAAFLDIDQAVLSKIERGLRKPSREQVIRLAHYFDYDEKELLLAWLSDKIVYEIRDEALGREALRLAETKVDYLTRTRPDRNSLIKGMKRYLKNNRKVIRAWIFGSFARQEDGPESDIDLMIEADPRNGFSLFDLAEIKFQLEKITGREVDVVMKNAPSEKVKEHLGADLIMIYEK